MVSKIPVIFEYSSFQTCTISLSEAGQASYKSWHGKKKDQGKGKILFWSFLSDKITVQ